MNTSLKVKKSEVAPIVEYAFPNYTGRKFSVEAAERVTFYDTNWGGGTRNVYVALNMDTSKGGRFIAPAPWVNPLEGKTYDLPENVVIVEHSIFCGKDCGIRIYAHPSRFPALLTN